MMKRLKIPFLLTYESLKFQDLSLGSFIIKVDPKSFPTLRADIDPSCASRIF